MKNTGCFLLQSEAIRFAESKLQRKREKRTFSLVFVLDLFGKKKNAERKEN